LAKTLRPAARYIDNNNHNYGGKKYEPAKKNFCFEKGTPHVDWASSQFTVETYGPVDSLRIQTRSSGNCMTDQMATETATDWAFLD
jgi:hypothetical protein